MIIGFDIEQKPTVPHRHKLSTEIIQKQYTNLSTTRIPVKQSVKIIVTNLFHHSALIA